MKMSIYAHRTLNGSIFMMKHVYFPIHKIVQENILNIRFEIGIFRIKKRQSNPISNRQHKNDSEFFFYFYLSAFHIYKNVVCQSCLS